MIVKESFEMTRNVKNNDKSKQFILRDKEMQDTMTEIYQIKTKLIGMCTDIPIVNSKPIGSPFH